MELEKFMMFILIEAKVLLDCCMLHLILWKILHALYNYKNRMDVECKSLSIAKKLLVV